MDVFRQFSSPPFLQSATSLVRPPVVGTYVYCLWTFFGIVRSSLLYSHLDQSNLVGGTVYCLWPFSGSVRHGPFLRRVTSPILPPLSGRTTVNDYDMLSYSLTTLMCFLTKEWYGFPSYTVNQFMKAYHRITYKEDLKSHKSVVFLRWYAFLCGFGSDVPFITDYLRRISFFCQNVHHDWLTKEYISN